MHTINIRNQFYLQWQKACIAAFVALFCICSNSFAQRGKSLNLQFYDTKSIHFGFQLGAMVSKINLGTNKNFGADSVQAMTPLNSAGFSLGFIVSLALGERERWNLRFLPNVAFYQRSVQFEYPNSITTREYENTFVEFPLLLKYKSVRRGNMRMYLVGGLTASFKVAGDKQKLDPNQILTIDQNIEVTYGFGLDGYLDFFKFAPELRFSHGLPNAIAFPNNRFANSIGSLTTHRVSLYLNFE
jgi:hypothetical protein